MAGDTSSLQQFFAQQKSRGRVVVTDAPKLDLESYISNYTGRTRFERLLLIGQSSVVLCLDALKEAIREAKSGKDINRYLEAQRSLKQAIPEDPAAELDQAWVDKITKQVKADTQSLEAELKQYKVNLIKESIRMGNEDLGKHYQNVGQLQQAYDAFNKMRSDVSMAKHIVDVSRNIISVGIEQRNWILVSSNAQKISAVQLVPENEKFIQPFVTVTTGLAHLAAGDYHDAALTFVRTNPGMGNSFNDVASPNDVAVYGALCALASMDRQELQLKVLENSSFRTYLELEPHLRRSITFFVNGRYAACLEILQSYRADYQLDIYLQKHVNELYQRVRTKSIVQYFIPFSSVTLDSMDETFGSGDKGIDEELVEMIRSGKLDARLDTQKRILTSTPSLARSTLHSDLLQTAQMYEKQALKRIQRANIAGANLEVRGAPKDRARMVDELIHMPSKHRGFR